MKLVRSGKLGKSRQVSHFLREAKKQVSLRLQMRFRLFEI